MIPKIKEFFRVLGEVKYILPTLRYKFPEPDDSVSLAHMFEATVKEHGERNFIIMKMKNGLTTRQMNLQTSLQNFL